MECFPVPYRRPGDLKGPHPIDRVVVAHEAHNLMTMRLQKGSLGGEGMIFAPGFLVKVMAEKNFQLGKPPSAAKVLWGYGLERKSRQPCPKG
jgi:hypothetical protein